MDKVRRQPMPPKSEDETDRYWGDRPVDAIARARRLTSREIETLDSVFRDSPAIGPGPIWGAVFAVEAAVLAFATATLDSERVIIRPWEAAIGAIPEWRPSPEPWPWMTSGTLVS
jgi:hypothetical protein